MPELPEAERARQQIERVLGREISPSTTATPTSAALTRPARSPRAHRPAADQGAPAREVPVGRDRRRRPRPRPAPRDGGPDRRRRGAGAAAAGTASRSSSRTAGGWRCATSGGSGARDRAGLLARRAGRRRGRARRVPRARRARRGAAEGAAARPGRDRRRRQPARRRDAVAREARPGAPRASCRSRSSTACGASCAPRPATRSATAASTPAASSARERGGGCPRCGTPLARDTIGGRTTYWCPACQPG